MTLRELFTMFIQWNRMNRAPRTADFYHDQLSRLMGQVGEIEADLLRPAHLLPWRQTWHLVLAVQRMYRWANEHDLVTSNPVLKLTRPRLGRRRRVLVRRDTLKLLRAAEPDFRQILLAAHETAARPSELRELQWTDLKIPEGVSISNTLCSGRACFVLEEFKGRRRRADENAKRIIPISPRLGRLLLRLNLSKCPGEEVFRTTAGRAWTYGALRCRMRKLRRRAGLGAKIGGENVVLYTLRHTAATEWAANGVQLEVCRELLGHARVSTTQRYLHLSRVQLLEEWRRFQDRRRSAPPPE